MKRSYSIRVIAALALCIMSGFVHGNSLPAYTQSKQQKKLINKLQSGSSQTKTNSTQNSSSSSTATNSTSSNPDSDQVNQTRPQCGDGVVQAPEECDDGNTISSDGCARCRLTNQNSQPFCGDGIVQAPERCDDGNTLANDGCARCRIVPIPVCGDGTIQRPEKCDDANILSGDGCSDLCLIETAPSCGDGIVQAPEECDDGNILSGDGCTDLCVLEAAPSCGDGIVQDPEECDDGNDISDDGCHECLVCVISIADSCADTDGGEVPATQGTVSGYQDSGTAFNDTDFCYTNAQVYEYSCDGTARDADLIDCAENEICENGACVPYDGPALEPNSCADTDGGEVPTIQGTVSGYEASGTPFSKTDTCSSNAQVLEYFCDGTERDSHLIDCADGEICIDGACVLYDGPPLEPDSCADTDGGEVPATQGTVSGYEASGTPFSRTDECISNAQVYEYFCDGTERDAALINCAENEICVNGACEPCDVCL